MSEEVFGGVSGAAQGFAVAGPVGAFVGAAMGFASGKKAKKARMAQQRAAKVSHEISLKQAAIQRRDLIRGFRMQRAMQTASAFTESGGVMSSTVQSATGSLQSQFGLNLGVLDWTSGANKEISKQLAIAGKAAGQAQMIDSGMKAILAFGSAAYGNYQAGKAGEAQMMSNMQSSGQAPVTWGASNMPQYSSGGSISTGFRSVGPGGL